MPNNLTHRFDIINWYWVWYLANLWLIPHDPQTGSLIHWGRVTHTYVSKLIQVWKPWSPIFSVRRKLVIQSYSLVNPPDYRLVQIMAFRLAVTSHTLNQCWVIVNCTLRTNFSEILTKMPFFSSRKCMTNIVCEKAAILPRGRWVDVPCMECYRTRASSSLRLPMFYHLDHWQAQCWLLNLIYCLQCWSRC